MKITRNPEFTATVTVYEPANGGQIGRTFKAKFLALTVSELAEYDFTKSEDTNAFILRVLIGWDGLYEDDEKTPFAVTDANVALLADLPWIRMALQQTYFDATKGYKAAARKN